MGAGTLAEKIDLLFRTVHPAGRGPYSYQEVAQTLASWAPDGRAGLSASAIQQLRTGTRANPTMCTLQSLARFFGVAPAYFFTDGENPPHRPGGLDAGLQAAVDLPGVRDLVLTAAALSEESRAALHAMAVRLREVETGAVTPRRGPGRSR
ncbi:helix-turn-helix domain-containing protein [Kitasatospora sp. NPDC057223]|uniref:helix-turn-helix domain-containing protein n=1 Tax=Kitasatospora sp. NPDC057223 TaxID=3346055 RepID=UPI003640D47A